MVGLVHKQEHNVELQTQMAKTDNQMQTCTPKANHMWGCKVVVGNVFALAEEPLGPCTGALISIVVVPWNLADEALGPCIGALLSIVGVSWNLQMKPWDLALEPCYL